MSMKRIATAVIAGCAAVLMSAAPGLAAQVPREHAAAAKAKPASGTAAKTRADR